MMSLLSVTNLYVSDPIHCCIRCHQDFYSLDSTDLVIGQESGGFEGAAEH